MTGCRHGAKNTLPTNYLYLAERAGAVIMPLTTVRSVQPGAEGGWEVGTVATGWSGAWRRRRLLRSQHVVLAAGAFGTQQLLHAMAMEAKLPDLSSRLGQLTRTNSESLLGAVVGRGRPHPDFSRGVAITSSFSPEPGTHVEPVRYGRGSNMMGLFGTLLVDGPDGQRDAAAGMVAVPASGRSPTGGFLSPVRPPGLVRAHRYRPDHAVPGQLPHRVGATALPGRLPAYDPPGARPSQPGLASRRP